MLDVLEAAGSFVEKILAGPVPENPARQRHFVVGDLHARGAEMLGIDAADGQRHLRHAQRFARVGAVENDIGHFLAAQGPGRLFAQNPANGVGDIGFAATIRADNGRDTRLKVQRGFVRKRLKP